MIHEIQPLSQILGKSLNYRACFVGLDDGAFDGGCAGAVWQRDLVFPQNGTNLCRCNLARKTPSVFS
jgi:hypothetical protein